MRLAGRAHHEGAAHRVVRDRDEAVVGAAGGQHASIHRHSGGEHAVGIHRVHVEPRGAIPLVPPLHDHTADAVRAQMRPARRPAEVDGADQGDVLQVEIGIAAVAAVDPREVAAAVGVRHGRQAVSLLPRRNQVDPAVAPGRPQRVAVRVVALREQRAGRDRIRRLREGLPGRDQQHAAGPIGRGVRVQDRNVRTPERNRHRGHRGPRRDVVEAEEILVLDHEGVVDRRQERAAGRVVEQRQRRDGVGAEAAVVEPRSDRGPRRCPRRGTVAEHVHTLRLDGAMAAGEVGQRFAELPHHVGAADAVGARRAEEATLSGCVERGLWGAVGLPDGVCGGGQQDETGDHCRCEE